MIVMKEGATPEEIRAVVNRVESVGARAHLSEGAIHTVVGAIGAAARSLGWNTTGLQDLGRELVPRARDTPRRSEHAEPTSAASPDA